jgi:hypothetical protein
MVDEPRQDPPAENTAEGPEAAAGGSTVNSQVIDAIAALNTLTEGLAPSTSAAMLGVMGADSIALAMLNAVARQQADATIASAALAAICARLAGTRLPDSMKGVPNPLVLVAEAEARAAEAIIILKGQADQDKDTGKAARAALARIARDAAPAPAAKAGKARRGAGTGS